jgi:2-dehydro-3-deoxyglucarate aldolase
MSTFSTRLAAKETLIGTIVSINAPAVAEIISHQDFDWIFIDAEHGALPIDALESLVRACSKPALIRLADQSEKSVKQALEVGAVGIIVPQVNDRETAKRVAAYAKYPPEGTRGVGVGRANDYGMSFADYLQRANSEVVVVAQIEHIDAVADAAAIIATPGIDAVLVGPNDLAASMDHLGNTEHPDVLAAIDQVRLESEKCGKPVGIFHGDATRAVAYGQQGFSLIACGVDSILLGHTASTLAASLSAAGKNIP